MMATDFFANPLRRLQPLRLWVAGYVACGAILGGCQGNLYKPGKLPLEYMAIREPSARKVDLAQLAGAAAQNDVIYAGDVIEVVFVTGIETRDTPPMRSVARVSDGGDAPILLVGPVHVAGLTLKDAEQVIRRESIARQIFREPRVSVTMRSRKSLEVTVVGAVENPGIYKLAAADNDLMHALVAAGGLTDEASTIVEIRSLAGFAETPGRDEQRQTVAQTDSVRVDLVSASQGLSPSYRIADGSVIMVREREPRTIQVIGLVRLPKRLEIKPDKEIRLLDALALAGGRTMEFANTVHVIRQLDSLQQPVVIEASIRAAKRGGPDNLLLTAGDVISVEETPLTFTYGAVKSLIGFSVYRGI